MDTLYSIFNLIKTKDVEFIRVAYGILQKSIHWVIYTCHLMSLLDSLLYINAQLGAFVLVLYLSKYP